MMKAEEPQVTLRKSWIHCRTPGVATESGAGFGVELVACCDAGGACEPPGETILRACEHACDDPRLRGAPGRLYLSFFIFPSIFSIFFLYFYLFTLACEYFHVLFVIYNPLVKFFTKVMKRVFLS